MLENLWSLRFPIVYKLSHLESSFWWMKAFPFLYVLCDEGSLQVGTRKTSSSCSPTIRGDYSPWMQNPCSGSRVYGLKLGCLFSWIDQIKNWKKVRYMVPDCLCLLVTENRSLLISYCHLELVILENSQFLTCYFDR